MKKNILALFFLLILAGTANAQFGGLSRWFNKEVIPTLKGKRPLNIDPTRIRISENGKDILRASTTGNGSLYVNLGGVKVQTNDLRKEILRTTAVLSGNTAVMSQVAFEQFQRAHQNMLRKAVEQDGVVVSTNAPSNSATPELTSGREVIVYNNTDNELSYAMNGKFYKLEPDKGFRHFATDGQFFLQFDEDPTEQAQIGRYYLTGNSYSLYYTQQSDKIGIAKMD
ncbi:hypothetical protein MUY27_11875 [Mucilaginibacter sp. RS28]|uniref:Uncharacterized protein n=1 Tax=Mucilaginibacter straminoryzae TaxID=2932774 RepID=A0A9X1X8B1_9SPHI|nr:hypothetical protein [Mucilaginibacter straminoryzae]MCJ8210409.1 hypothetical protein [Mucilaginibacter straminoryzae]